MLYAPATLVQSNNRISDEFLKILANSSKGTGGIKTVMNCLRACGPRTRSSVRFTNESRSPQDGVGEVRIPIAYADRRRPGVRQEELAPSRRDP